MEGRAARREQHGFDDAGDRRKGGRGIRGAMTATSDGAIERIAVRIIEAAMAASGALRDSPRLNVRLNALRPSPAGPQ